MSSEPTTMDVCRPIKSLSELYIFMENPPNWAQLVIPISKRSKIVKNADLYCDGNVCHYMKNKIQLPARYEYGTVPRTLVCHDMKNGYHEDSSVDDNEDYSAYSFYHWAAIDMFVYFSHHFITIPPLGWINAAHKHGVQIMGTIITEWQDGFQICEQFLQSEIEMEKFVHEIVVVSKYFKLDGWLLNIENQVDKVEMLLKFVKYLTVKMHQELPGSVVMWYDSVTRSGSLEWQNCLNEMNIDFFNACDGIFTNYCWTRRHLEQCVQEAGSRRYDVFVGVDVWGRNFWGGGCFNTVEAVKEIHNFNLSMAIFAPAWTHEAIQFSQAMNQQEAVDSAESEDNTKSCSTKQIELYESVKRRDGIDTDLFRKCAVREHFILRESALWNSFWPFLNSRGPSQLPFQTFFCLGSGEKRRMDGEVIKNSLWFNLREQQYQISIPLCQNSYILESETEVAPARIPTRPPFTPLPKSDAEVISERQKRNTPEKEVTEGYENKDVINIEKCTHEITTSNCTKCNQIEDVITKTTVVGESSSPSLDSKPPIKRFTVKPNMDAAKCISLYDEDSFYGGSCIKISPVNHTSSNDKSELIRLLICEFLCDYNFIVYYAIKNTDEEEQDLNLLISLKNNNTGRTFCVILSDKLEKRNSNMNEVIVNPENQSNSVSFRKMQENLLSLHPGFYIPVNNDRKWKVRYFYLKFPNSTMLEINCELTNKRGTLLLGGLGIVRDIVPF